MSVKAGAAGAVISIVTDNPGDAVLVLPARSVVVAVIVWTPEERVDVVIV